MADAPGYLIGPKLLAQIQSTVRHYAQMYGGGEAGRTRQQGQERRWAILDADLLAAHDMFEDPSTATAHLIDRKANGDLEVTDETVTVVNRFENISIDADTLIGIEFMCGEWTPYKADCGPNSQGASSLLVSVEPEASAGTGGP
jgi:hypothetical protein